MTKIRKQKKIKLRGHKPQEAVVCATCSHRYTNIWSLESNQASSCASDLVQRDGQIVSFSHYGSKLDTMKHIFKDHGDYKLGVICDDCLIKARAEGVAEEDETYDFWVPVTALQEIHREKMGEFIILPHVEITDSLWQEK